MEDREINLLAMDLTRDEAERLKPYKDSVGKLTIGVGRNLDDVGISAEESRILLFNDIARVLGELDRQLPWWRGMSEGRQRALANMAFNLGLPRLRGFKKMLTALETGQWEAAHNEALTSRWAGQVGQRANRIAQIFLEG